MARAKIVNYYNHRYKGSLTDNQCYTLETILDLNNKGGSIPSLKHVIYDLTDEQVEQIKETGTCDGDKKLGELTDMQTLGVGYMYHAGNCILGDSVGLGKTVQFAGLCNLLKSECKKQGRDFYFLYLTEKNLVMQAQSEFIRFTGEYVDLVFGDKVNCSKFVKRHDDNLSVSVVGAHSIIKSGVFLEWLDRRTSVTGNPPFVLLGIDESSILGNSKSAYWKATVKFKNYFERLVFLNATPFEKQLSVFYNQLNLLDGAFLPTKTNFDAEYVIFRYNGSYREPSGQYKNADKFRQLVSYRYLKRTRKENGAVMKDCVSKLCVSPLTPMQKSLLKRTSIPQLVYDCPNMIDDTIEFNTVNVPKLDTLWHILFEDFDDADTVLLFVHYKEAQYSISRWLDEMDVTNKVLNGETSPKTRYEIINGFKRGDFRILITNVQKGLNFGDCDFCIFYGFDPNPNKMVQMEGRITRSFDIIGKTVYLLCSEGNELKTYEKVVKQRAKASKDFSGADLSCIMDLLLNETGD